MAGFFSQHARVLFHPPLFLSSKEFISRTAAVITAGMGCIVLVGWIFDIAAFKSLMPQWVTMKANTAIAFLLTGLSLHLALNKSLRPIQNTVRQFCTVCVSLIGMVTLAEYVFDINAHIDEVFFNEPWYAVATSHPGRMAPSTALNFSLIGLTLLVRKKWSFVFIHIVFGVSIFSLIGYVYGVVSFYGIAVYTKMAFHTSLVFIIVSIGILFMYRESSLAELFFSTTAGGMVIRRLLPAAAVTLIALGWLRLVGQRAGLYNVEFGIALTTFGSLLVFTLLFWRSALRLHRIDVERSHTEMERNELMNELELRVQRRTAELTRTNIQLNTQIQERERAEERYKSTLDHMMEGCQIISDDYRYVYLNDAAAIQGRIPKEQLIGKTMMEMYPGIDRSPFFSFLKQCMEERIPHKMENEFKFPDGSIGWFMLNMEPVPEGVFILSQDITEEKLLQREVQKHKEHLEELVAQRTTQLHEANKELEAFSYSVSHDLRAPLRHINGFVDLLTKHARHLLDEKSTRYLHTIASSAKEMGTLIDELLVFSRMGRAEMRNSTVDIHQITKEIIGLLRKETEQRDIVWNVASLPVVEADPSMIRLVIQNLLDNAVKYTRPREKAVIEIGSTTQDGAAVFYVRDNGVGFDMQYKEKLFGVFQRLHRAQEFEGTGIGLANVRRIIQRHGGHVWAESEIDRGATFYFSLPLSSKG